MCRPTGERRVHENQATPFPRHGRPVRTRSGAGRPAAHPGDPNLRASDAEREATAAALRGHAAAGRLELVELEARLGSALAARTRGELAALLADLPERPSAQPPAEPAASRPRPELAAYLWVMALLVGIWLLTGAGHPWPLYPALGWGIPLLLSGAGRRPRLSTAGGRVLPRQ